MFEAEIETVEIKNCCGTWCVWITDHYDERMKVAMFDLDDKKEAVEFAKNLAQQLNAKYK